MGQLAPALVMGRVAPTSTIVAAATHTAGRTAALNSERVVSLVHTLKYVVLRYLFLKRAPEGHRIFVN